MKIWISKLNIELTLTEKEIQNSEQFIDPKNPTKEEINNYFENLIQEYAGSNDGSELLANAKYNIIEQEI